jgi:hypothetical protein
MILWSDGKQKRVPLFFPTLLGREGKAKITEKSRTSDIYRGRNDGRLGGSTDSFTESAFIKIRMKSESARKSLLP